MDGDPVYATRNQGTHLGGTRLCVLDPNHPTRKIPAQEHHLALPSLRIIPKEPQTFGTAVRNKGFGFVIMIRPLRGVPDVPGLVVDYNDTLSVVYRKSSLYSYAQDTLVPPLAIPERSDELVIRGLFPRLLVHVWLRRWSIWVRRHDRRLDTPNVQH